MSAAGENSLKHGLRARDCSRTVHLGDKARAQCGQNSLAAKSGGETLDWVCFDEEPPLDIYTEGLTRTNRSQGPV
jgi:hypothetical protein